MAVILAIDSAIGISSVAVWNTDRIVAYRENREQNMQSAQLVPLIEETLQAAAIGYSDLTHVACSTGPGSFTGIRIGLATARGIAFAASIPSLGYTTLHIMAEALPPFTSPPQAGGTQGGKLAIINAGKGEVYYQYFGDTATSPAIGRLEEVLMRYPDATIASAVPLPASYAAPAITFPRADALATLAATNTDGASVLSPFYIRPPDAKPQIISSSHLMRGSIQK